MVRAEEPPTFGFSGRIYPKVARIVRVLCAAAGRWWWPLGAAVAVTVAVSRRSGPHPIRGYSIASPRDRGHLAGMARVLSGQAPAYHLSAMRGDGKGRGDDNSAHFIVSR